MRSLQPPDILWIHWRVYNFIVNTSKRVLFLPPSDAYVRSFFYLLYTLIKLYYTKALSDQASSLAPDWILLLRGPRIPVSLHDSTTTFQKLSLSPLYFNKTLLHKISERSSLVSGPRLNSSPPGTKNPSVFAWFNNNISVTILGDNWEYSINARWG